MFYLSLSIVCSMLVSVLMRVSEKHIRSNVGMLAMNYVMCALMALFYTRGIRLFPTDVSGITTAIFLGVINGVLYLGAFLLLQWNIRISGVVLPSTFMKIGVIVPIILSITVFGDKPDRLQIAGIVISVGAILLIQLEKGDVKAKNGVGLVLVMLCGGFANAMSKVFECYGNAELNNHFLLYTFICAMILCALVCVIKKQRLNLADIIFGMLIGVPNYLSSRFLLLALSNGLSPLIVYPCSSVGSIVLITLAGVVFFRERLSKKQIVALALILIALVLLNLKIS